MQHLFSEETHACIHRVAVNCRMFLFQGFMQQTADLQKGSLPGSQTYLQGRTYHKQTPQMTSLPAKQELPVYKHSITLCFIFEYLT